MKSSSSIERHLIVLALATIFLTNPMAFSAYALNRSFEDPPPATDLHVFASADQEFVPSGGQVILSFTALNNGGYPAENVTISSGLLQGVTLDSVVSDGGGVYTGTPGGSSFSCVFQSINPSESKTVSISFIATGTPYALIGVPFAATSSTLETFPDDNSGVGQFYIASPPLPTPTPGPLDEAQLAYMKFNQSAQGDIFRQRADAAGLLNLTNNLAAYSDFSWSPDGGRIAFVRTALFGGDANLYVMDADGANLVRLTNDSSEQDSGVAWSPDSTHLAFLAYYPVGNTTGIHTVKVDGSDLRILTSTTGNDRLVAWSPDGTRLSFTRSFFDLQAGTLVQSIYMMNSDGSSQIPFDNSGGEIDYYPAWSPDGTQIAFVRSPNDGLHLPNLFLAQQDGTNMRNLTNDYSVLFDGPQWSPDGSKLSFLNSPDNLSYRLSVINADGSGRTTPSGSVDTVSFNGGWSPDGAKLAFSVNYGEVFSGFYTVNVDGTGLTHIGDDREHNDSPAWSPDSSKLTFTSLRNGKGTIDIVNADGTNRVDLTGAFGSYSPAKWRPVPQGNTPAGANVTVTVNSTSVTFSNVTTAGQTTVTPIDPTSLTGVPGEYVINANSLAFEIHTTAVYSGPITIGFQVGVNNPITFSALRVLHGEPVPNFVDRTILAPDTPAPDFATRTIYARVTSLSPFLVTERILDQTPPTITINAPGDFTYLLSQSLTADYSCMDPGSGVGQCAGPVPSGSQVNTGTVGAPTFTVNAHDNAGNASSLAVNYRITYGINPLFDQTKANKSGSTIPIKLELVDVAGVNRSAANIVVTATAVTRLSNNAPGALQDPGNSNPDFNFRYTGGQYHFNLKTSGYATGTYRLDFQVAGDPVTHAVQFQVK